MISLPMVCFVKQQGTMIELWGRQAAIERSKTPTAEKNKTACLPCLLQVRSVVRFLDKDFSGTVDVRELDNAIRNFRALRRECPSLGAGPLTVLDPSDLDRLATYSFAQMLQRRQEQQRCQAKNSACQSHSGSGQDAAGENSDTRQMTGKGAEEGDMSLERRIAGDENVSERPGTGYSTGPEGADDVCVAHQGNGSDVGGIEIKDSNNANNDDSNHSNHDNDHHKQRGEKLEIEVEAAGGSSGDTTTKPAADTVVSGSGIATVSVSEIAAAFKKAAREFEAQRQRGRQQGSDQASQSTTSTGNNYPHPSTDTKQAKVRHVWTSLRMRRTRKWGGGKYERI